MTVSKSSNEGPYVGKYAGKLAGFGTARSRAELISINCSFALALVNQAHGPLSPGEAPTRSSKARIDLLERSQGVKEIGKCRMKEISSDYTEWRRSDSWPEPDQLKSEDEEQAATQRIMRRNDQNSQNPTALENLSLVMQNDIIVYASYKPYRNRSN
eukprot:6200073-Pleurochrysis_carterae.AAC.4